MPSVALPAAGIAAAVLIGSAGTQATWTARATIPGATLATVRVAAPDITCDGSLLSWGSVPDATAYEVYVAAVRVATVAGSSFDLSTAAIPAGSTGPVTVRAEFGPTWVSIPSATKTCSLL